MYKLYKKDFRDLDKITRAHSLVIDPPYCSGGMQEARRMTKNGTTGEFKGKEALLNDSLSTSGYMRMMRKALGNAHTEEVYIFLDWKMYIPTFEILEDCGFLVKSLLIWNKMSPGPGHTWRPQHELIFWSIRPSLDASEWGIGNVIDCRRVSPQKRHHPTQKPDFLMQTIIDKTKTDLIVDYFAGSGSTGVAALRAGKDFIGCEMSEKYYQNALTRLEQIEKEQIEKV